MYHVPYGYVIVFIALDVIPSIEKKVGMFLVRNILSFWVNLIGFKRCKHLKNGIQVEMVNGLQVEIIRKINAIQN